VSAPPKAVAALVIDGQRREVPVAEESPFSIGIAPPAWICRSPAKAACAATCRANLVGG